MAGLDGSLREGHFAKKQMFCKDRLISWSHRSRFEVGLSLARSVAAGRRVLDYGCGDGTFLSMLMAVSSSPSAAVGCEVHANVVDDCRKRLGRQRGLSFVLAEELDAPEHEGACDVLVCMEVLEHVVDVEPMLEQFVRLLAPAGKLIVSVPVETGLPLIVKQVARRIAGWRGIGDYPGTSPYTLSEYRASVFAGRRQHLVRPIHTGEDGRPFHDHKGFNWMALRDQLAARFHIEKTFSSPVTWLSPHLASQAWFLMHKKA